MPFLSCIHTKMYIHTNNRQTKIAYTLTMCICGMDGTRSLDTSRDPALGIYSIAYTIVT